MVNCQLLHTNLSNSWCWILCYCIMMTEIYPDYHSLGDLITMTFGFSLSPSAHLQVINLFHITCGVWVCCLTWLSQRLSLRSCGLHRWPAYGDLPHHCHTSMSSNSASLFLANIICLLKKDWFGLCFNIPCSMTLADKDSTQCIFHNHCHRRQKIPHFSTRQLSISTQRCQTSFHLQSCWPK